MHDFPPSRGGPGVGVGSVASALCPHPALSPGSEGDACSRFTRREWDTNREEIQNRAPAFVVLEGDALSWTRVRDESNLNQQDIRQRSTITIICQCAIR